MRIRRRHRRRDTRLREPMDSESSVRVGRFDECWNDLSRGSEALRVFCLQLET